MRHAYVIGSNSAIERSSDNLVIEEGEISHTVLEATEHLNRLHIAGHIIPDPHTPVLRA